MNLDRKGFLVERQLKIKTKHSYAVSNLKIGDYVLIKIRAEVWEQYEYLGSYLIDPSNEWPIDNTKYGFKSLTRDKTIWIENKYLGIHKII